MLERVTSTEVPWTLGVIDEGWEWLAFTFHSQSQISLSKVEIEQMLQTSDSVVKTAYSRMALSCDHKWMRHTSEEVDFIVSECNLHKGDKIIDFGCGNGRHAIALAKKELSVIGIDYLEKHIENAAKRSVDLPCVFYSSDCREIDIGGNFADAVICLYDVIGSYADNRNNQRILDNLYYHLKPGGFAVISVMNYDITLANAKNKFVLSESPDILLTLRASNNMEKTGYVFNPDYYAVDTEEHIVYRKEQFLQGGQMPAELIVRDRRFTRDEIVDMCKQAGFEVVFFRRVKLQDWSNDFEDGKEILVKCRKPSFCSGYLNF
jgi:2-polyprenyl-3-methyl-5-hydroxy-6-metoxy-1,4-benzoquinol methylase